MGKSRSSPRDSQRAPDFSSVTSATVSIETPLDRSDTKSRTVPEPISPAPPTITMFIRFSPLRTLSFFPSSGHVIDRTPTICIVLVRDRSGKNVVHRIVGLSVIDRRGGGAGQFAGLGQSGIRADRRLQRFVKGIRWLCPLGVKRDGRHLLQGGSAVRGRADELRRTPMRGHELQLAGVERLCSDGAWNRRW